jgi:hypothetical protein
MMKNFNGLLFIALMLSGCTEFIAETDTDTNWKRMKQGPVKLYYKPQDANETPSPTKEQAKKILNNQIRYYEAIQDSIRHAFSNPVLIYLYNKDEAKEAIGTSTGGLSQSRSLSIYYTFIHDIAPYTDKYGVENPYIGAYELVHVIKHNVPGHPGTKMMSEGYAVWLDGSYARNDIAYYIRKYKEEYPEYLLTPTQLLNEAVNDEMVYYPNAGIFVRYSVRNFGIRKINQLFNVSSDAYKQAFENNTDETWEKLTEDYMNYLKTI